MMENEIKDIPDKITSLFSSQTLGVLSTCGSKGPYANLISFAASDDLTCILFVTPRKTHKYANMQEDKRVALLVDNSQNTPEDFKDAMAVTATGSVEELIDGRRLDRMGTYLGKHPKLEGFLNAQDSALMMIRVKQYVLVEDFQMVRTLKI